MFGDVVTGKFPIGLSSFKNTNLRKNVVDLNVFFTWDYFTSYLVHKSTKIDPGLFLRPFTKLSWVLILLSFFVYFLLLLLFQFFEKSGKKVARAIIELGGLYLFVILYAYYGGALTMFFTVEPKLPFQTTEDALMAVPNWKVLIVPGHKGSMKEKALKAGP